MYVQPTGRMAWRVCREGHLPVILVRRRISSKQVERNLGAKRRWPKPCVLAESRRDLVSDRRSIRNMIAASEAIRISGCRTLENQVGTAKQPQRQERKSVL